MEMKWKRWLAGCLSAAMLCGGLPAAGAADAADGRQEDLDMLMEILTEKHPDFFTKVSEQTVLDKKAEIERNMEQMDDFDFAVALSELTALGGDSHTMLGIGQTLKEPRLLPFAPAWYDGRWTLAGTAAEYRDYIGQQIVAVAGCTMDEVQRRIAPMISYDNETRLRRDLGSMMYIVQILEHYGLVEKGAETVSLTVRDAGGKETVLSYPVLTPAEYAALGEQGYVSQAQLRKAVPPTEPDKNAVYKLLDLGQGTLYMQYNACREDPNLPIEAFAAQITAKLESGAYEKFVIDLRYNGGGSDGVLYPVMYAAQQFLVKGGAVYALAGENTFSSALINTVQLKDIGATVVGAPTGGSVDHFGQITGFTLPYSGIRGQYSNKFIDLGVYEAAKPYGIESFPPDIAVEQRFADYLNGVDTAVQEILKREPVKPELRRPAEVSSARLVVDGKAAAAAAYEIGDSNYFKLRDLAMAFAGTRAAFQVNWDGAARRVTLSGGVYTPVGGELLPLEGGTKPAVRADAEVYVENMPLLGKAYMIDGNHYFKLRDLCMVLGVSVSWDGAAGVISIDTSKPYMQ
jgi:hypothetical protein